MTDATAPPPADPTPAGISPSAERTVLLDAGADRVLEALTSPDVLTAWLGEWRNGDTSTVVTDEGVTRRVERRATTSPGEVSWRWSPVDEPENWSDVRFVITTEGARTRLTVTETLGAPVTMSAGAVRSASATAPAVSWLPCLLALGAVLAVGSLVPA